MRKFLAVLFIAACLPAMAAYLEAPITAIPDYMARFDTLIVITPTTLHYTEPIYGAATRTTVMFPLDDRALPILTATETAALVDDIASWLPPLSQP